MRTLPCVLQAAKAEQVRVPDDLPVLPSWWPPQPAEGPPNPESDREAARVARGVREARRGPYDGQRGLVVVPESGPPAVLYYVDGGVGYRLDKADSTPEWLVYRYSPADSHLHRELMDKGVTAAFTEVGAGYTEEARLQTPQSDGVHLERIS